MQLSKANVIDPILRMAKAKPKVEVTGMVARGPAGDRVVPMVNVARRPEAYYEWDATEMRVAWDHMEGRGEEPVVFYHSHPNGMQAPSSRDMEGALMEGMYHLIVFPTAGDDWYYSLWECIEVGILVHAKLDVVT